MKTNPVKAAIKSGQTVIGSEITGLRSPEIPRIYARSGFDFVFIDTEHTSFSLETVADMIRSARDAGIVPIVRVPQAEYSYVAKALDIGAQGVIVPRVNTPEMVEQIVSWVRYPPHGIRGFAGTVAQTDGEPVTPPEFIEHQNRETLLVIQIERCEAVENLDAMLSFPEVDVACLGCMDLTADLGIIGDLEHPDMVKTLQRIVDVAKQHDVASGIITGDMAAVTRWVKAGMRFVSYSAESLLLQQAATAAVGELRSPL